MKRHSQRAQRVADQIQRELGDLLVNEVKDPRVGRVTVTQVDVSADLSHATVHFSHLAGKEHAAEAVAALSRTAGFYAARCRIASISIQCRNCTSPTTIRSRPACGCRS